ncbi:hypothetical protein HX030_13190 [Myroides odoratimimus]|uniref:hypothetical protein n=1 Tax=Myroides odoratimimus TaxID=76832 RepID=UPI002576087A|nr:hypothetical protein [Myroides odoratimimus]MDM1444922.1 hypothetical protein [Myroides odoratimimus]MDM1450975.1 hypothetical protein [Myroides odoratimimus]MDM1454292.1 hypothetical protein [Myroides odoratimimus]MDM1467980.1 hypothetical protein [Myroides odoratimimus]MDM1471285.1 hypothetical protein [Myroides odoratimimus]
MKKVLDKGVAVGKQGLKSFRIVLICLIRWIGMMAVGVFLSLWIFFYSMSKIYQLRKGSEARGFWDNFTAFFSDINYSVIIIFLLQVVMIIAYFYVANKYAIQKAISLLWEKQGSVFITNYVAQLMEYLHQKKPTLFGSQPDKEAIQRELIALNEDNHVAGMVQRKTTNYVLSNAKLGNGPSTLLQQLTTLRFNPLALLPGLWMFYALVGIQILFILYIYYRY